ncbi:MAG: hypothetical protein K5657_06465 [Desulfovibrio sp.]|nr:hypothetical protein [Desulfovibrio sp.]
MGCEGYMTSYKEALLVGGIRIGANVLMIVALFLAMYMASKNVASSMMTFCIWFFGLIIPLWVGAIMLIRHVRKKAAASVTSFVCLPGMREPCLVEWKVCSGAGKAER